MTAEQLMIGIQEMIKRHPEWKDWSIYNTYEGCFSIDFGFLKYDLNNRGKMPEEANVGHWYEQKWFLDANNIEPDEDLKNEWQKNELKQKFIEYFQDFYKDLTNVKYYYDDTSFEYGLFDVKQYDTILDFTKLTYSDINIIPKIRITSEWSEKNFVRFLYTKTLWAVCDNAIKPYINCQLDDFTKSAIECKIKSELFEYCGSTSLEKVKYNGIEIIKTPIEFGNGIVFVITFEI